MPDISIKNSVVRKFFITNTFFLFLGLWPWDTAPSPDSFFFKSPELFFKALVGLKIGGVAHLELRSNSLEYNSEYIPWTVQMRWSTRQLMTVPRAKDSTKRHWWLRVRSQWNLNVFKTNPFYRWIVKSQKRTIYYQNIENQLDVNRRAISISLRFQI